MRVRNTIGSALDNHALNQLAEVKKAMQNEESIAQDYANMIPNIPGELYSDTCKRLGRAIRASIDPGIFRLAVKLVRSK